ncbi:hypothetical protein C455_11283 [Haloferax larsenii JCM 13917]|nr:hypothetical protein C455_11283 [Haloferax larsenii JCM 13917]
MVRSLIKGVKNYKSKKHQATGANVNEFVEDNEYQIVEVQLYEAVLFNIGCKLIELQINGNLPDVDTADKDPRQKDELRGLFNDFAEYEIDSPHYDFEHIWDHLYALLSSDYSSSLELIEEATQRYRI